MANTKKYVNKKNTNKSDEADHEVAERSENGPAEETAFRVLLNGEKPSHKNYLVRVRWCRNAAATLTQPFVVREQQKETICHFAPRVSLLI